MRDQTAKPNAVTACRTNTERICYRLADLTTWARQSVQHGLDPRGFIVVCVYCGIFAQNIVCSHRESLVYPALCGAGTALSACNRLSEQVRRVHQDRQLPHR